MRPHCFPGNYSAEEDKKEPHTHISLLPLRIITLCSFLHNNPRIAKHIKVSPAVPGSLLPWGSPSSLPSLDRCAAKLLQKASLCPGQQSRPRHHTNHPSLSRKATAPCPSAFNLSVSPSPASKGAWWPLYRPCVLFCSCSTSCQSESPKAHRDAALGYPEDSVTLSWCEDLRVFGRLLSFSGHIKFSCYVWCYLAFTSCRKDWLEYMHHPKGRENNGGKVNTSHPSSKHSS